MLNSRNKKLQGNKQRYLNYGDVFMSGPSRHTGGQRQTSSEYLRSDSRFVRDRAANQPSQNRFPRDIRTQPNYDSQFDEDYNDDDEYYNSTENDDYDLRNKPGNGHFSYQGNDIINEQMVRYQKRQLPQLQRYSPGAHRDVYAEFNQSYWDEYDGPGKHRERSLLGGLWQKFILTFASILSLVCIAWIAYNWNNDKPRNHATHLTQNGIPIAEPTQSNFKVLPDNPGGAEISYKDKTVYDRVDGQNGGNGRAIERLLPPQEETFSMPEQEAKNVEEYSILDDKTYYIKISAGKDKQVLINEANLLRKKFSTLFSGKTCAVKKVSNSAGIQKHAILVGPFDSQDAAIETAREIGQQCYVISVRD